jgi:hypothetical protein
MKPRLRLTIVGNGQAALCEAGCGADWSRPETLAKARQTIRDRFGDRVRIEYVDVARKPGKLRLPDSEKSFPLLLVEGNIRLAGQFDIRQVLDITEAQLEMGVAP